MWHSTFLADTEMTKNKNFDLRIVRNYFVLLWLRLHPFDLFLKWKDFLMLVHGPSYFVGVTKCMYCFAVFMVEVEGKMSEECLRAGKGIRMSTFDKKWKHKHGLPVILFDPVITIWTILFVGERLWPNPPRFLDSIADGIRVQQLGELTWPIILKLVEKEVFSVVNE